MRGLQGLSALGGVLTSGGGAQSALREGARVSEQPLEETAWERGARVAEQTGSPLLGAATYALNRGLEFVSPY